MPRPKGFVEARLYNNEEDIIQDALRYLLRARLELRLQLAVHRYQTEESAWPRSPAWAVFAEHR